MAIVYNIENPHNNAAPRYGMIRVEGWAFSGRGEQVRITVYMDRRKYLPEQHMNRADVRDAHPAEVRDYSAKSGFYCLIELTSGQRRRSHVVQIRAREGDDSREIVLGTFFIPREEIRRAGVANRIRRAGVCTGNYLAREGMPHSLREWRICLSRMKDLLTDSSETQIAQKAKNDAGRSSERNPYQIWTLKNAFTEDRFIRTRGEERAFSRDPLLSVIMPARNSDPVFLREAVESTVNQIYENWELCIEDDASGDDSILRCLEEFFPDEPRIKYSRRESKGHISAASNSAVLRSQGEYLVFLDHDDLLTPDALYEIVRALNREAYDILYSDDDKIGADGQLYDPQFKPEWSPDLLLSYMYFSHVFVIRRSLFDRTGGFRTGYEGAQDYDLALRASEKTAKIGHIPKILYHWRAAPDSTASGAERKPYSLEAGRKAVQDALDRRGIPARAVQPGFAQKGNLGIYSPVYTGRTDIPVSIVIPVKNQSGILSQCVSSIEKKTTWKNYEIILVDDGSDDADALEYLDRTPHTVVRAHNGSFNFSALINLGVSHAKGDYIILLNNDTEVISPGWIEAMMVYMAAGAGAVGARLLYRDRRVQHAGVVLRAGNGLAGHAFKLLQADDGGYLSYSLTGRNYSAVTAASLMTSAAVFGEVGGFDEETFAVSYNDVDFCLRVRKAGYRIVYQPAAVLYHYEGASRGTEQTGSYSDAAEKRAFFEKWIRSREFQDPFYSPHLSYENGQFSIRCDAAWTDTHRNLRIFLITHNLNYEGAPLVQFRVASNLLEKGYRFLLLSAEDGPLRAEYEALGIPVHIAEISRIRQDLPFEEFCSRLKAAAQELGIAGFDLLYANTAECFWGISLAEKLGIPSVWGIHESLDYRERCLNLGEDYREAFVRSFKSAARVLYVARATADLYAALDTHNTAVIRNGIDTETIRQYRNSHSRREERSGLGCPEKAFVITVVGTVCERKGQLTFARAAKLLRDRNPHRSFLFQIVGARDSAYLRAIQDYIGKNNLEGIFRIEGHIPHQEVYRYYQGSDLFVCASLEESSPLVILEAMAFEVPVVSTRICGIPEILRDRQDGILTEPDNPDALADAVQELLDNPELRKRLSRNAWNRVHTFYTEQQMTEQYDSLFQSVYAEGLNPVWRQMAEHTDA